MKESPNCPDLLFQSSIFGEQPPPAPLTGVRVMKGRVLQGPQTVKTVDVWRICSSVFWNKILVSTVFHKSFYRVTSISRKLHFSEGNISCDGV